MLAARGPSGYETAPAAVWRAAAAEFAEVSTDLVGTPLALVAPKKGVKGKPRRLLVMGHIDEIGLIVTHIDDSGFLWFGEVGGWDPQVLVGQRVVIDTRGGPVSGVVGRNPAHSSAPPKSPAPGKRALAFLTITWARPGSISVFQPANSAVPAQRKRLPRRL